ncbi:ADP-ribosylation factor-like protein 16 [Contarinia nasturtii]|uniref:ADP-ribosylation factor-like protein 16 n=1 Tax=Contarinia nasturtii TaxID=265458 RepID=UPI0012D49EB7|nr:ADP-ribosylation factor-like protein 16 [Contarinia nasturtii]
MGTQPIVNLPTILCLGPRQSGKTHLLSSLQLSGRITNVSHSVQTIGTNIFTIKLLDGAQKQSSTSVATASHCGKQKTTANASFRRSMKNPSVTIMEIGGMMAPMWTNYLNNVSKILYVIDTSNLCQISAAGVLLYSLLADPRLQHTKFLLILTKMDLAYRQMRNEMLLMIHFEKLKKQIRQSIQIVETSSITCSGHQKILEWLSLP